MATKTSAIAIFLAIFMVALAVAGLKFIGHTGLTGAATADVSCMGQPKACGNFSNDIDFCTNVIHCAYNWPDCINTPDSCDTYGTKEVCIKVGCNWTETNCTNRIDDDNDTLIDCEDLDCANDATAQDVAHGSVNCNNGTYRFLCDNFYDNCDGNVSTGCEQSLLDVNNCGACNNSCPSYPNATATCIQSGYDAVCSFTCNQGYADSDNNITNGCEAQIIGGNITGNITGGEMNCTPAAEICNGIDDNCNNQTDENITESQTCGVGICANGLQVRVCTNGTFGNWSACSTDSKKTNETCNGLDDDCDGTVDNGLTLKTFYRDSDSDSYGNKNLTTQACSVSSGYVNNSLDCDDTSKAVNPGTKEVCINNIDDNCNGIIDGASEGCGQQAKNTTLQKQTTPLPKIGDGKCDPGETSENDPIDCGCPPDKELIGSECKLKAQVEEEEPTEVCGNNIAEGIEQCDGSDAQTCPDACQSDCICAYTIRDGVCSKEAGENSQNSPVDCSFKYWNAIILLAAFGGIAGAGVGVWYFKFRPKETLGDVANLHDLGMPGTVQQAPESIESYINHSMSLGFTPEQIRASLVNKGWDVDTVDEKLASVGTDLSKLQSAATAKGVSEPSEDTSKAEDYVSSMLKNGYGPVQIKTALMASGWDEQAIEGMFAGHKEMQADLNKIADKADISEPSAEHEANLKDFAKQSIKKGHTTRQIKKKLAEEGWDSATIKKHIPV